MLDFLKILLSKESRQTVAQILDSLRKSPEWRKDLVILDEQFQGNQQKETLLLVDFATKMLATKAWEHEEIQAVRFVCLELIRNAFEHGLKDNPKGKVRIRVSASSDFFEINITDPGPGFDLQKELERQQANDRYSKSCRALAFVYRLVTELSYDRTHKTIRAFIRKKYKACKIEKIQDITVFQFQGETQPSGYFWAQVVDEIESLPQSSKILLDFSEVDDLGTRVVSEIFSLLHERGWYQFLGMSSEPSAQEFLGEIVRHPRVAVSGINHVNDALRQFLQTHFLVFENAERAILYLKELEPK